MYEIIETEIVDDNGRTVAIYGIQCATDRITDISCDKAAVSALVADCNRYKLSTLHLRDVVQDFLEA